MSRARKRAAENAMALSVESLLSLLKHRMQHEPPPILRERLKQMSSQRLAGTASIRQLRTGHQNKRVTRTRKLLYCSTAGIALALILGGATRLLLKSGHHPEAAGHTSNKSLSVQRREIAGRSMSKSLIKKPQESYITGAAKGSNYGSTRLIIPLPYSNRFVTSGGNSAVRITVSQAELMSFGVPVNPRPDRPRYIADLLLGADGLPRALSVPLPLKVVGASQ